MNTSGHEPNEESLARDQDYYFDGPYLVFTAAYHQRRGYCCESGCRHCPWRATEATGDAGNST